MSRVKVEVKLLRMIAVKFDRLIHALGGNSLVEFALVAPVFFLMVFGILDFGRLFFWQETLQYALRQAGRYAVTGQHQINGTNTVPRVQSIINVAQQYAAGIPLTGIQVSSVGSNNFAGYPGDEMTISLVTPLHLITPGIAAFFPNGIYTFTTSVTFRNEPFGQSQTN